jgi:hypothetical protein
MSHTMRRSWWFLIAPGCFVVEKTGVDPFTIYPCCRSYQQHDQSEDTPPDQEQADDYQPGSDDDDKDDEDPLEESQGSEYKEIMKIKAKFRLHRMLPNTWDIFLSSVKGTSFLINQTQQPDTRIIRPVMAAVQHEILLLTFESRLQRIQIVFLNMISKYSLPGRF